MDIPPRMKMFAWRASSNALPANAALANRVHSVDARCRLCGHLQESAVHALLECDHAAQCFFTNANFYPRRAITKALDFVQEFREADQHFQALRSSFPSNWNAPIRGLVKINFDGAKLGDWGRGWGVVGRDSNGVILFSYVKRVGNRVAHTLAHLQPYSCLLREWLGDGPDHVLDLALKDDLDVPAASKSRPPFKLERRCPLI
ncbi:hypothetical protein Cgig2_002146 [Carnegiea gigantea]|uniref:Reverse transcriptase zinc-binding domain-containing protein n=1 Tax=Carnegiea gigantea TaxID=171969 RepID=A0A9Q1KT56_9CARY|nr:hypothetical protein Cgig2_002146 [Carnegiea gigantea]